MQVTELIQAIQTLNTEDAFRPRLDPQQWRTFGQYLTRHELRSGDLLVKLGADSVEVGSDLADAVRRLEGGKATPVTVWRDGKSVDLTVTVEATRRTRVERPRPVS